MDVLGPLRKMESGNQHVTVLTGEYTIQKRPIMVNAVTRTSASTVPVNNLVISYKIPTYLLTDYRLQFISRFFAAVTARMEIRHQKTAVYHH